MRDTVRRGWCVLLLCALGTFAASQSPQVPTKNPAATTQSTGAQVERKRLFKNIQSLRGVSAGRLPLIMAMFTKSLGVGCEHCHVEGMWELDDKPEKTKARGMLSMVGAINGQFYGGNGPVHCVNCHQGNVKPELVSGTPSQGVFSPAAANLAPK